MAALRNSKPKHYRGASAVPATDIVRPVLQGDHVEPVASPAHDLHRALHDAGYRSEAFRPRPMSNVMLVLSVVCVYAVSMLMFFGGATA